MKKDVYPDVRIEIISEGLTKKILGKTKDAAPVVYGEEQPEGKNLPNVSIKGKNKELQSVLETSNKKPTYTGLVKEAIQELRKDAHDKEKPADRINYGDLDDPEAFTRISDDFDIDDYQNPDKFISPAQRYVATPYRESGNVSEQFAVNSPSISQASPSYESAQAQQAQSPVAQLRGRKRSNVTNQNKERAIASEVASQTQNMVKEAIHELRKDNHNKAPIFGGLVGQGDIDPTDPRALRDFETRMQAGRDASKKATSEVTTFGPGGAKSESLTGTIKDRPLEQQQRVEEKKLQSGGTDSGYGSGIGPGFRPAEFASVPQSLRDYKPPTPVSELDTYDPASVSSMGPGGTGREATSGEIFNREFEREQAAKAEAAAAKAEADALRAASEQQTDDEPDEAPVVIPLTSGPGGDDGADDGAIDEIAENIKDNVIGTEGGDGPIEPPSGAKTSDVDPKIESEIDLGVRANPEVTRPKNSKGDLLPQFGSSGYFSAIVELGENRNKDFYGVSNLPEFLSLYAQNPQFNKDKFLENLGIEIPEAPEQKANIEKANPFKASLKKQAPPMAMTMNRPPNMGVGMQQPVVTGAGTMKNTEKAVAANKPAATPAKTKARSRKPKTIEMMVKSITDRIMKQQESDVDTFSSQKRAYGDVSTGQMDYQTGDRPGTAFTRMTESGTDEYGSPDQFQITPPKEFKPSKKTLSSRPEVYRGE